MSIKVVESPSTWYFSSGVLTEHMRALYHPQENRLVVISIRHLTLVIKELRKRLDITKLILELPK